jgi:hypothetical protein
MSFAREKFNRAKTNYNGNKWVLNGEEVEEEDVDAMQYRLRTFGILIDKHSHCIVASILATTAKA